MKNEDLERESVDRFQGFRASESIGQEYLVSFFCGTIHQFDLPHSFAAFALGLPFIYIPAPQDSENDKSPWMDKISTHRDSSGMS